MGPCVCHKVYTDHMYIGAENVMTKQHIDKIWKDEGVLKVYFINDKLLIKNDWKYRGQPISIKTIMEWAHTWNLEPIPYFEVTEKRSEAHVRVEFTGEIVHYC